MDLTTIVIHVIFSYLATVGFAVTMNIPRSALNVCGLIGVLGWMTYKFLYLAHTGMVLANLVAAVVIGICSVITTDQAKADDLVQRPEFSAISSRGPGLSCSLLFCF